MEKLEEIMLCGGGGGEIPKESLLLNCEAASES